MQYIILKLRSSTINILIRFLPEIYAVLITKLYVHFNGPINNMLIYAEEHQRYEEQKVTTEFQNNV